MTDVETKQEAFKLLTNIPKHTAICVDFTAGETEMFLYKAPLLRLKNNV